MLVANVVQEVQRFEGQRECLEGSCTAGACHWAKSEIAYIYFFGQGNVKDRAEYPIDFSVEDRAEFPVPGLRQEIPIS